MNVADIIYYVQFKSLFIMMYNFSVFENIYNDVGKLLKTFPIKKKIKIIIIKINPGKSSDCRKEEEIFF